MLWSLTKVVTFLLLIAALAVLGSFLSDTGGMLRVSVAGLEFSLGPVQAVVVLLLLFVALWLVLKLAGLLVATLRFLNGDETAISRHFDRNRERKGYAALTDALVAIASGESAAALQRARTAERLLDKPELTTLLMAQAAEAAGDSKAATAAYRTMLATDATRFVAVRGLLRHKLAEGDTATALKLAEKALALKPRHHETQDVLLKLQADAADWKGARATLTEKLRSGALPRSVYRRRDALLAVQEARAIVEDGNSIEAREAAIEANRQSPDLVPAAVLAARALVGKGDRKGAARVLRKAWEAQPHPDLAAAFAEIEPDEDPAARLKRFRPLLASHPGAEETRLLRAELLLAAGDFPAARTALGDLAGTRPTQRSLAILAAAERGAGADDATVRGILARALAASRGPQWCCDKCESVQEDWNPICPSCGGFDTLSWREPAREAHLRDLPPTVLAPLLLDETADAPADEAPEPPAEDPPAPAEPDEGQAARDAGA